MGVPPAYLRRFRNCQLWFDKRYVSTRGYGDYILYSQALGDEDQSFLRIIGMNSTPIVWRDVDWEYVKGRVGSYMDPQLYFDLRDHIYADFNYLNANDLGCIEFSGRYPDNLHEEINNYSIVAGVIARQQEFEIIHSHDWLTYPGRYSCKTGIGQTIGDSRTCY